MMIRRLTLAGLALTSAGLLTAAAAPFLFSDDFSSGTDANWVRLDLLAPLGGTSYDASSGRYEMSSNAPLPPLPFQVFTGSLVAASINDPAYRNCTIRATIRFNNANSNVTISGRIDASQASSGVITGIACGLNNITNEMSIGRGDASGAFPPTTIVTLVSTGFAFTEGVDYAVEVKLVGQHITLKVWEASAHEPGHAQLAFDEPTYQNQTGVAVGLYSTVGTGGQLSGSIDHLTVRRGGS